MSNHNKWLAGLTIAVVGAGIGLGSGFAIADVPNSSTGNITACRVSGDAGNVRIIDKEAGQSCHPYEDEISWSSGYVYAPKLQVLDFAANGSAQTHEIDCPTGEKFVASHAGTAVGTRLPHYPGAGENGSPNNTYNLPVYDYIVDGNGVITGVIYKQGTESQIEVTLICSP